MASWCDGGDAEWEGIVQAKNDLLSVKDDALTELQKDLDRQRALIARMNKVGVGHNSSIHQFIPINPPHSHLPLTHLGQPPARPSSFYISIGYRPGNVCVCVCVFSGYFPPIPCRDPMFCSLFPAHDSITQNSKFVCRLDCIRTWFHPTPNMLRYLVLAEPESCCALRSLWGIRLRLRCQKRGAQHGDSQHCVAPPHLATPPPHHTTPHPQSSYGGQGTTSTASLGSEIPAGGGRITSVDAGDWRHDATYGATHDRLGSTAAERVRAVCRILLLLFFCSHFRGDWIGLASGLSK